MRSALATSESSTARWLRCSIWLQHQDDGERDADRDQHQARQREPRLQRADEMVQPTDHERPAARAIRCDIIRRRFCVWSM